MSKFSIFIVLAAGLVMFSLSGCMGGPEAPPTTADLMRGHAADVQSEVDLKNQLAEDWERGAELVRTGRERVNENEQSIREANEQIEQGKREIAEGNRLMEKSENAFRENFPGLALPGQR